MGRIIVIDGTSNAGKTTLCENIERNIKNVVEGKKELKRVNHYLYSYKLFYMNFQYLE